MHTKFIPIQFEGDFMAANLKQNSATTSIGYPYIKKRS